MTPTEFRACFDNVWSYITTNNLSSIRENLKPLDKETKRKILSHKRDEQTPFFLACQIGCVKIVDYFLCECEIDLEQRGQYKVAADQSRHMVTPLWCASVANHLSVVKTLVQHGADVNGVSDTESTPVRSACYMTNIEIVKYLVDHKADIHKPNINGGTCLINAVQSPELCEYLIDHGASVNAQDNSGNLALHYAIREGRLETVKLLVKYGSDVSIKNDFGDDSLQTAALRGFDDIVKFLIDSGRYDVIKVIEAYELMGANYVDEKHDIQQGLKMWRKAALLRQVHRREIPSKDVSDLASNPAYENVQEFSSMSDLDSLAVNPDNVYMQALLVRERILGPMHKDTTFGLMYRGAVYADTHNYQRCIDIWSYALFLRHKHCLPLSHETVYIHLLSLTKLFWEIWNEEVFMNSAGKSIRFQDIYKVLVVAVEQLERSEVPEGHDPVHHKDYFITALLLTLHLINLVCALNVNLPFSNEDNLLFRKLVHRLLSMKPLGHQNESLVHLALDCTSSYVDGEMCSYLPTKELTELLLDCGADVNAFDDFTRTPLHILGKTMNNGDKGKLYSEIADILVTRGAHVDVRDIKGVEACAELIRLGCTFIPFDHMNLKCIAAKVIQREKIRFEGEVPQSLVPFVKMH